MEVTVKQIADLFGIDPVGLGGLALLIAGVTQIVKKYISGIQGPWIIAVVGILSIITGALFQHATFFEWARLSFCLLLASLVEWELILEPVIKATKGGASK